MHTLATSFVLGYHGCEREVGEAVLRGEAAFKQSDNDYDWLGPGIYFWEADPVRGIDWARKTCARGKIIEPFVVGAIINLGYCFDLMSQNAIEAAQIAYAELKILHDTDPNLGPLPVNSGGEDNYLRRLDCAVIRHLHSIREDDGKQSFDTVRGLFREGKPIYDNSGFYKKSHIQIAVRNPEQIKGYFRVQGS
jgi:hypothetical protein